MDLPSLAVSHLILSRTAPRSQASSNPANTVFDIKRLIGRKYSDTTVKADVQLLPFKGEATLACLGMGLDLEAPEGGCVWRQASRIQEGGVGDGMRAWELER